MKAVRLLQIVIVLAAGAYLVLLHDMNEVNVVLPFLFSLPPAAMVVAVLLLGWLLAWLPAAVRGARQNRELRQLRRRLAELEPGDSPEVNRGVETPVIPDRRAYETGETAIVDDYEGQENI